MDEQTAVKQLQEAVKAIKALEGISGDEAVMGAIDMYSAAIATFVANSASSRTKSVPESVKPVDVIVPDAAEGVDTTTPDVAKDEVTTWQPSSPSNRRK